MEGWLFDPGCGIANMVESPAKCRRKLAKTGWSALLRPAWLPAVAVLVGGVLLHSMNVLMLATVLPSVVDGSRRRHPDELDEQRLPRLIDRGGDLHRLPDGDPGRAHRVLRRRADLRRWARSPARLAPSMAQVVAGRFVQGFGGGLLTGDGLCAGAQHLSREPVGARLHRCCRVPGACRSWSARWSAACSPATATGAAPSSA